MACGFGHRWDWPRRENQVDVQRCTRCGLVRRSAIQFCREQLDEGAGLRSAKPSMSEALAPGAVSSRTA